jgi:hypothetical protein
MVETARIHAGQAAAPMPLYARINSSSEADQNEAGADAWNS